MFDLSYILAMGQMRVVGGDVSGNLRRAARMIQDAAKRGVDAECLVVVPISLKSKRAATAGD